MNPRPRHSGFTLIEVILVMVIVCIVLAMAAPALNNWNRGSHQRDAADQILALTRYARTQAIADATVYRFNLDTQTNQYWLTRLDGQQFVDLGNSFGQKFSAPDDARLDLTDDQNQSIDHIDFFSNGRTQPARLRLTATNGDITDIQCSTPAEGFQLASAQQGSP
jgi:type II secretion system protein H